MILIMTALLSLQGGYKPTECFDNQCTADPADAKVGRWTTYATEAAGAKTLMTTKVVGKVDDDWLIEHWMDLGPLAYGYLFQVASDRKIKKAWAAAKGDAAWTAISIKQLPKAPDAPASKPNFKQSEEVKEVQAGKFKCVRLDVKATVQGKDYAVVAWYSDRIWKLHNPSEHGGMAAVEESGSRTRLDGMGEDAKPTLPLP